jgi:LPS export ABC transporter protein LptC
MNRKIRISLAVFIVLSVLALAVSVFVHYQTRNSFKVTFNEDKKLEVRIEKVRYSGTKDGRVEWELVADSAQRARGESITAFHKVTVTFYAKGGEPYTLTAREALYDEAKGIIDAVGDVKVESKEGFVLKAGTLRYDLKKRVITSDEEVDITSRMMNVKGRGFFSDIESGGFKILKNVRAVVKERAA